MIITKKLISMENGWPLLYNKAKLELLRFTVQAYRFFMPVEWAFKKLKLFRIVVDEDIDLLQQAFLVI